MEVLCGVAMARIKAVMTKRLVKKEELQDYRKIDQYNEKVDQESVLTDHMMYSYNISFIIKDQITS